jgi:DNA polymerase I-like protein with 3'-5' exonuclease and polymerase domains
VNLPSSRVVYGEQVRSCIIAREGMLLAGADLSSLENRIKFNLQLPYDREYVFSQMSDDFDPHLAIAEGGELLTQQEVWFYKIVKEGFQREDYPKCAKLDDMLSQPQDVKELMLKDIAKARGKGKNSNYALQYSCGIKTLARTAGVSEAVAKKISKAYKSMNWSIDKIAADQVVKKVSHGTYQLNQFNGIWYHLKTDKDRFSTLVQGTGSYVLDLWLGFQFNLRKDPKYGIGVDGANLLATAHDEQIIEFKEEFKDNVKSLIEDSLNKVNDRFKLEIPFGCDVQFGSNYSQIH